MSVDRPHETGSDAKPHVWFERPVLSEFAKEVASHVTVVGPATPEEPYAGLSTAAGVVAGARLYDAAFMQRAPSLKVIARTGIGYDRVDTIEASRRGIAVCNTPDGPTISTAEHAATLMLMVAKSITSSERSLVAGETDLYADFDAIELRHKLLGLVGYGRIGRHLASIASGIGMRTMAFDPFLPDDVVTSPAARAQSLDELLQAADVVSVHVPLTDRSRNMFGSAQFRTMKPRSVFINTARGGLVDTDALLAAIDSGHLFGAGLDVTEPEPLPHDHPLLHRGNVVVTPHVASGTAEGKARLFVQAFEQVLDVLNGKRPEHLVNPDVWDGLV